MKFFLILIIILSVSCGSSQKNNTGIIIIPKPESVLENDGFCRLDYKPTISGSGISSSLIIDVFSEQVKEYLSLESGMSGESDIEIIIEPGKRQKPILWWLRKIKYS